MWADRWNNSTKGVSTPRSVTCLRYRNIMLIMGMLRFSFYPFLYEFQLEGELSDEGARRV